MSVKDEVEKIKGTGSSNVEAIAQEFNGVAGDLLKKALSDIKSGNIQIRDTTDLEKVYRIYKDVNGLTDGMQGTEGEGALPELNAGQEHVIEQRVKVNTQTETTVNGDVKQTKTIKLSDLADLSSEDVSAMMHEHEKKANNENAKELL